MRRIDFIPQLNQILLNYKKSDPIYIRKLKAELVKQFKMEIPISVLETYLIETGYTNIYLKEMKQTDFLKHVNKMNENKKISMAVIDEDDDDFDPNMYLERNKDKIQALKTVEGTFRDNSWMIAEFQKDKKIDKLDVIIQKNMRLVEKIAYGYSRKFGHKMEFDDLVHEGIFGLMIAVNKFDPDKGYQFSTYATWWIRQKITRAIVDKGYTVRIPVHMYETINKVLNVERQSILKFNRIDTEWVVSQLDMDLEQYKEVKKVDYRFLHLASLDRVVSQEDEDSTLMDFIETNHYLDIYEVSEDLLDPEVLVMKRDRNHTLIKLMDSLKEREREVLLFRFGFIDGQPKTLEEIGQIYNLTRERIRQIESRALEKMRKAIKNQKLDYDLLIIE